LVGTKVDLIVSINTPPTLAATKATNRIPIVMLVGDAIGTGIVSNLSRPEGNVTGLSILGPEITAKRLQLLMELVPAAKRVAALLNPDDPVTTPQVPSTERAAAEIGVEVRFFEVRSQDGLIVAFKALTEWHADGVLWLAGQAQPFVQGTIDLAAEQRLPAMMVGRRDVMAGGLISYSPDFRQHNRRLAVYVDKILKGAIPAVARQSGWEYGLSPCLPRRTRLIFRSSSRQNTGSWSTSRPPKRLALRAPIPPRPCR
jgi:putative ABC transport system substrate-binding protein